MNAVNSVQNYSSKYVGMSLVIVLHAVLIYALSTGLARVIVDRIKPTTVVTPLPEPQIPPPNDPLPQVKLVTPQSPFIPAPDLPQPAQEQQTITDSTPINRGESQRALNHPESTNQPIQPIRTDAQIESSMCDIPEYPRESRKNQEMGTVVLRFLVGMDGKVLDSQIESSSGHRRLDEAARRGLSLCRFKPGTVDGKAQQSWARIQYVWKLED